jgi:hypothetical protein
MRTKIFIPALRARDEPPRDSGLIGPRQLGEGDAIRLAGEKLASLLEPEIAAGSTARAVDEIGDQPRPEADGAVVAARGVEAAIRREGDFACWAGVALQDGRTRDGIGCAQIPEARRLVVVAGDEPAAICRDGDRGERRAMSAQGNSCRAGASRAQIAIELVPAWREREPRYAHAPDADERRGSAGELFL